jgi:hypothetical protein
MREKKKREKGRWIDRMDVMDSDFVLVDKEELQTISLGDFRKYTDGLEDEMKLRVQGAWDLTNLHGIRKTVCVYTGKTEIHVLTDGSDD